MCTVITLRRDRIRVRASGRPSALSYKKSRLRLSTKKATNSPSSQFQICATFPRSSKSWRLARKGGKNNEKSRARPGFEPGTTRTLSGYHTPRPTSRACPQHISNWCPSILTPVLLVLHFGCISHSLRYGLVVRISGSHPGGPGSIPGNGTTVHCGRATC